MTSLLSKSFYRPLRRKLLHLVDAKYQRNRRELNLDYAQTEAMIGSWSRQGAEYADPNRLFAIIGFTNLPLHAKFHGLMAKTLQLRGYTPVVFTYRGTRFGHKYLRLFGVEQLVEWESFVARVSDAEAVDLIAGGMLPPGITVEAILRTQFHGVDVGKHAMSATARRRFQGKLDPAEPETCQLLHDHLSSAVQGVLAAEAFFDTHPVKKMLVRDSGYIPNGAIYEVGLQRGVDCVVYEQGQRRGSWILKRYTPATKNQHYFSVAQSTWEQIKQEPWTAEDDARLEQLFAGRYKPDSTDDTRHLMTGKQFKQPDEVRAELGLDPNKKTAVIFSHIAWDAAFFYGSCLFDDFEHWLFETVKFVAAECPEMNWIVKLHPFNVFKLQRENREEELEMRLLRTLMPLPDNVRIMRASTPINTQSLFPVIDYVLTVNGTVGMEFPCFGIPALLAGTGRYNGLGFTIEPPTRDAYFEQLKTLHSVPRLSAEVQTLARRHFYTVVARRQTDLSDAAVMELKRANEAESDVHDNIHLTARSLEEFAQQASIRRVGEWFADLNTPDILEPKP